MKRTPIYRPSTMTGPPLVGLARYGSTPGCLLTSITDSILNGDDSDFGSGSETTPRHLRALTNRFFSSASAAGNSSPCLTTSESSCCKDTYDDADAVDPKHLLARQSSSLPASSTISCSTTVSFIQPVSGCGLAILSVFSHFYLKLVLAQ